MNAVVTGATSGIGREVARLLAEQGARVIGVGRSAERCQQAQRDLRESSGSPRIDVLPADLSSLAEIRRLAAEVAGRLPRIDVLVNNAGVFTLRRVETVDGLETQLAVNWLSAFALTGLLMDRLLEAGAARIVNLSSGSHYAGHMHWDDLGLRRGYTGLKAYDQSKLAMVLFTRELSRRYAVPGAPAAFAVDPGLVRTGIGAKDPHALVRLMWKIRTRKGIPAARAADSVAWCALEPRLSRASGRYWKEKVEREPSREARDPLAASRLWEIGEGLSGVRWPRTPGPATLVVHSAKA
jgi:NAD(P)-dependent dehydrogenase (short-subunit alcohol dehydrogenase family)